MYHHSLHNNTEDCCRSQERFIFEVLEWFCLRLKIRYIVTFIAPMCNSAFVNSVNHKQDSKRTNCKAYDVECVVGVSTITLCNFVFSDVQSGRWSLSGNGCGSPNWIEFLLFLLLFYLLNFLLIKLKKGVLYQVEQPNNILLK